MRTQCQISRYSMNMIYIYIHTQRESGDMTKPTLYYMQKCNILPLTCLYFY